MTFLSLNGVRTHVQKLGGGAQKLVFVHGLVVDNLSSFYFTLASPLATAAEVLLYDLRGHGKSERPKSGYGLESLMDDLAALLDTAYPGERVYLAGNSFGGLLALVFAARRPERVAGLVLFDPLLPRDGWQADMVATLSQTGDAAAAQIAETYKDWHGRASLRKSTRLGETAKALVYETSLLDDVRASPALSSDELARIACPVLAVYGDQSGILDQGRELERVVAGCTLRIVAGCTHLVLFQGTRAVVAHVEEWLRERARDGRP